MTTEVLEAARAYLALEWCVIPVLPREKTPGWDGRRHKDWHKLRLTTADLPHYLSRTSNVGVFLGEASGHLVDVDLDCAEAIELAPRFLPLTWTFGRRSKRASHWLYRSERAQTAKFEAAKRNMLVELRSTGAQTVFPPSIHESGEQILWSEDMDAAEQPTCISSPALRARAAKLAAASLAMRYAGRESVLAWIAGADCPQLPPEIERHIREILGLPIPTKASTAPKTYGARAFDVLERASRYVARMPPAISGSGGHVATLLAAEHLVRGFDLDDEAAYELLATHYNPRCDPPWTERELHHKVSEAREHGTAVAWGAHLVSEVRNG